MQSFDLVLNAEADRLPDDFWTDRAQVLPFAHTDTTGTTYAGTSCDNTQVGTRFDDTFNFYQGSNDRWTAALAMTRST